MIQIRKEVDDIVSGRQPKDNNVLKNAPHPISVIAQSDAEWNRSVLVFFHETENNSCIAHTPVKRLLTHYPI